MRAMAAAFSVQLDLRARGRGPAGAFLGYNEAALNGSGQLRGGGGGVEGCNC